MLIPSIYIGICLKRLKRKSFLLLFLKKEKFSSKIIQLDCKKKKTILDIEFALIRCFNIGICVKEHLKYLKFQMKMKMDSKLNLKHFFQLFKI